MPINKFIDKNGRGSESDTCIQTMFCLTGVLGRCRGTWSRKLSEGKREALGGFKRSTAGKATLGTGSGMRKCWMIDISQSNHQRGHVLGSMEQPRGCPVCSDTDRACRFHGSHLMRTSVLFVPVCLHSSFVSVFYYQGLLKWKLRSHTYTSKHCSESISSIKVPSIRIHQTK